MTTLKKNVIEKALSSVKDVTGQGDIVARKRVERIVIEGDTVALTLLLPVNDAESQRRVEDESRRAIKALGGVREVMIMTRGSRPQPARPAAAPGAGGDPWAARAPIDGVRHVIAVSSAKGGVGKSTVCVNLALALAKSGARVGLMDADVYGPSVHILTGGEGMRPQPGKKKEIAPIEKDGLKLMSLGFLSERDRPVIWRGPIVMGVVKKFLQDVDWGELDYLMIDMPPGTGDAQLTLVQTVPVSGAIIVTTPSELALVDAEKGLQMYRQVDTPVLGIIENMSYFVCPHCDERTDIFATGGGRKISERLDTEFFGDIPLDPDVRAAGDEGDPIVKRAPDSPVARAFAAIATRIQSVRP